MSLDDSEKSLVAWLLEVEDPSIRFFTLRDLMNKPENDENVQVTKASISDSKVVKKILSKQSPKGYWENSDSPYQPKYKSSFWQIMIMGQLGCSKEDERVRNACNYIFKFQHEEGGFTSATKETARREYRWRRSRGKKLPSVEDWVSSQIYEGQLSCLTGNLASALIRIGYKDDDRVQKALDWLIKIQNQDGGWLCPYWKAHVKDKHGCFHGTICALEAFSEVKGNNRTSEMKRTIQRASEFLLMHRLYKADHHDYQIINRSWLKFSFPRLAGYDVLRGLDILTKLSYVNDERLDDAVKLLLRKRNSNGTWNLEKSPSRMHSRIETVNKPSKWITLIALRVLKQLNKFNVNFHSNELD